MDFTAVITERESTRKYDPARPVPPEVLHRILEAGRIAPSAANRQPWRFLLVSSPEMLAKVRPCYERSWLQNAPHILIVLGKKSEAWVRESDGYNALETDLAIALDHMILAAENEGVATCWIAAFKPDVLFRAIGLQPDEMVYAITPLGYLPAGMSKKRNKQRKPLADVVRYL